MNYLKGVCLISLLVLGSSIKLHENSLQNSHLEDPEMTSSWGAYLGKPFHWKTSLDEGEVRGIIGQYTDSKILSLRLIALKGSEIDRSPIFGH